jgi:hypothetical protein
MRLHKQEDIHKGVWTMLGVRWSQILNPSSIMFGHKLRYDMKVMFGEISLKLRQTNWNVAINNVNVFANELLSQIEIYTCLTIDIWTDGIDAHQQSFMCFGAIRPK